MRLDPQRFTVEEFPEQRSWIEKLFSPLNSFTESVVQAFNNQITISDNLYQEIKEIKYVNTTSNFPYKIKTKFNAFPKGVFPIYTFNNTIGAYSTLAPHVVWKWAEGQLILTDISGLTASSTYTIRLLIIYG